jgi:hypothetical protein
MFGGSVLGSQKMEDAVCLSAIGFWKFEGNEWQSHL